MDDIGSVGIVFSYQAQIIESGNDEKPDKSSKTSEKKENETPEILYSVSLDKSGENLKKLQLEKLQEKYNSFASDQKFLNEVKLKLQKMKEQAKGEGIQEKDQKILHELEKKLNSILPDDKENKQTSHSGEKNDNIKTISQLMASVIEKQQKISQLQKELSVEVSSLVELRLGENVDSYEAEVKFAKELRKNVEAEILDKPKESQKIQIKYLNRDLLLAMVTLKS
jgi:hypothetical protein